MFQGVNPGRSHPKGKITLPVTFGGELNYRTERIVLDVVDLPLPFGGELNYWTKRIVFDVVDLPLPYNGILGCPALAKFMAASHHAYNTLKIHGLLGVITNPSDEKDAIICVDKMYQDSVAAETAAAVAPSKESKGKKRDCRDSGKESRKHAPTECMARVDDVPECSNNKRSKVVAPQVRKVPTGLAGVDGTFTINATLDDK